MKIAVEICVDEIDSAVAAEQGGADRVELCFDLAQGGTTPSIGVIETVCRLLTIPVHVLIRPRGGDFVYSRNEASAILRDIQTAAQAGASGVVIGALASNRTIDHTLTQAMVNVAKIEQARPMSVTFHRAFDSVRDQSEALELLIPLKIDRILTSGGRLTAIDGIPQLAQLQAQSSARITILAGAGIQAGNVARLIEETGIREVHAGSSVTKYETKPIASPGPVLFDWDKPYRRTDSALVRAVVDAANFAFREDRKDSSA